MDRSRDFVCGGRFSQMSTFSASGGLTSFQLYLGQSDSGYWIHHWCLRRFHEMPRGVKNRPFGVTNPAGLDVPIRQDSESVCELYRSLCEFHCLFENFNTTIMFGVYAIGIPGRDPLSGGITRIMRLQQQNSSGLP